MTETETIRVHDKTEVPLRASVTGALTLSGILASLCGTPSGCFWVA